MRRHSGINDLQSKAKQRGLQRSWNDDDLTLGRSSPFWEQSQELSLFTKWLPTSSPLHKCTVSVYCNGNSKSITFKESLNYVHSALEENVIENTNKQPKTNTVLQRINWQS